MISFVTNAQKKELQQVKTYLKQNKELDKAEKLIRQVLAMPGKAQTIDNYVLLSEVTRKEYENANMKLYLRQLNDTASLFPLLKNMFGAYELLDSVDALPNKKGVVELRHRKKNAEFLNTFRRNLFSGGTFYIRNKKYAEALSCLDFYFNCEQQPLFGHLDYAHNDTLRSEVAYYAVVAARNLRKHDVLMKYSDMALGYEPRRPMTYAMLYDSNIENGDTVKAVTYLRTGFDKHPEFPFFFPRLVDYYSKKNQIDTVSVIVNKALELEPGNLFYRLALNTLQLNNGQYDECIALGDSLIHNNDKMAEAYMNVGTAYYNKALERDKKGMASKSKRKAVNALYEKARPYLERYRQLRQRRKKAWAPMLYNIYLNLNMGDEFDEISELMKEME